MASMVRSGVVEYKAHSSCSATFAEFSAAPDAKRYSPGARCGEESRVRLPGLEAVEEVYDVAAEEGQQDLDYAATLTLLEKWAGVEVKAASK